MWTSMIQFSIRTVFDQVCQGTIDCIYYQKVYTLEHTWWFFVVCDNISELNVSYDSYTTSHSSKIPSVILKAGLEKSHTAQQAVSQKGKGRKGKNDSHVIKQLLTEFDWGRQENAQGSQSWYTELVTPGLWLKTRPRVKYFCILLFHSLNKFILLNVIILIWFLTECFLVLLCSSRASFAVLPVETCQ